MSGNDDRAVAAAAAKKVAAERAGAATAVKAPVTEMSPPVKKVTAETAGTDGAGWTYGQARRILLPLGATVVALLVALIVVGFLNVRHDQNADAADAAQKIVAARVTQILSYSPSTVTSDLEREGAWLTGDFADEYATLVKNTVGPAAKKGGVTTTASVVARGVDAASRDRVTLLLFVNLETTRTGSEAAQVQGSRVRVTADKVDGQWLISELKPL